MANIIQSQYADVKFPPDASTFPEFLLGEFLQYSNKVALISPKCNKSLTYSDVIVLTRSMAIGLKEVLSLEKGDVISTCLGNHIELVPFMLGVNLIGAVMNTANPAFTVRELVTQFNGCSTRYVLTTADRVEKMINVKSLCQSMIGIITFDQKMDGCFYLSDLISKDDEDFPFPHLDSANDIAFSLNSSGTTDLPKGVMLTHKSLVANLCQASRKFLKSSADALYTPSMNDISLSAFPMFHIGGIIAATFWMLLNGATVVMFDRYCANTYLRAFKEYSITASLLPPPILVDYTKSPDATPEHFNTIKYILVGGACVGKSLSDAVAAKFRTSNIVQVYGMTELSPLCHATPLLPLSWQKHGSCGRLLPNTLGKVIDIDNGEALGPMAHGELCIKGPQVMKGYLNDPKATGETISDDGWLHTGDIAYYDQDEYFYIVDRIKDVMKVKGFQVAPAELEGLLFSHPAIAEAVVIGVPDEYAGELPRAYVIKKPGAHLTEEEVKQFLAERVVSYKRLQGGVRFVDELPKTPSGKLLRRILREQAKEEMMTKV